jgi:hypothetical protein
VKRLLVSLITALSLSCCALPPPPPQPSNPPVDAGTTVHRIQVAVVTACGWLPLADSLLPFIPGVDGIGTAIGQLANVICAAVRNAPAPAAAGRPMEVNVNGTTVTGTFVRGP